MLCGLGQIWYFKAKSGEIVFLVSIFDDYIQAWFVVLKIYVALAILQPNPDFKVGDNQSLRLKWRDQESNPGHLALQARA